MSGDACRESDVGLPPLFTLRGLEGSLSEYLDWLHWQYRAMVSEGRVTLWGKPLMGHDQPTADGRDRLFWHLVTDSIPGSDRRVLSLERSASLGRVWWLLERAATGDPGLERPRVFVLRTAYPVNNPETQRQCAREAWAGAVLEGVADGELYTRARGLMVRTPRRTSHVANALTTEVVTGERDARAMPDIIRTPAAIERVRCWM